MSKFVLNSLSPLRLNSRSGCRALSSSAWGNTRYRLTPCPGTPGFFSCSLSLSCCCCNPRLRSMYIHATNQLHSPGPARPSSPLLCPVPPVNHKWPLRGLGPDRPTDHSGYFKTGPMPPIIKFECVPLLSARLSLVPPPPRHIQHGPPATPQGPLSPAADSPNGPQFFSFSSLPLLRWREIACFFGARFA
jgi:hypothetical protein